MTLDSSKVGQFGGDLAAVEVEERAGQVGEGGVAQRIAVAVEAVAVGEIGALVGGEGVENHGLAVVVVGVAGLELLEQGGGGFVERVLVHDDAAVARLDERPEDAGGGEVAQRLAIPIAVGGLAGDQRGHQRAGAGGELARVSLVHLAGLGVAQGGGGGEQVVGRRVAPGGRTEAGHGFARADPTAAQGHVEHGGAHVGSEGHAHPERRIRAVAGQTDDRSGVRLGGAAGMGGVGKSPGFHGNFEGQRVAVRAGGAGQFGGDFQRGRHGHGVEGDLGAGFRLHLDGLLPLGEDLGFVLRIEHAEFQRHGTGVIGQVVDAADGADFIAFAEEGRRLQFDEEVLAGQRLARWPGRPAFPPCNRARSSARRWWFPASARWPPPCRRLR